MVSRTGYVQARNDVAVLFVIIAIGGLMVVQVRSSAENITSSVRDARQVENEWASTSKKDHKGPNTYAFSYDVENSPTNNVQYRMEERHPNGSVVGSYGQVQPGGQIRVISYIADMDGVKTYVKDNGGDQYVAEGSSLDPIQRVTSQIIETASKSQQQQHRSPLYDKYHRPTPSTAADRVVTAHAYHQQRTKIDPATFRPHDSPGFRETEQPFIGDQLKDKLHATQADYHVQQTARPLQPLPSIIPYNLPVPTSTPTSPQLPSTHYVLNVPPLPALADNSPLPLLPGQQPLPITPNRGPITIQLQHQQQSQHYQPLHEHQQQLLRLPPPPQQQFFSPVQAQQQYQQQPVRIQSPAHLHQNVQYHPQQARAVAHQVQPAQQHQRQLQQLQQQHQQQLQQQQQKLQQQQQQQLQQQQHLQQQQQQQQKSPYQQSVMQQPYTQHVNIPAHPSQLHLRGTVQQHHTTAPMQFFHQPNPATTMEQYRQQLQLQAAESRLFPAFALPPDDSVFDFDGNR